MAVRPFAVFDIDGTLIRWQMFHAIFNELGKAGYYQPGEYEKIIEARKHWKTRKSDEEFKKYEAVLIGVVVNNLTRIPPETFDQIIGQAFEKYKDQAYRYSRGLIKHLRQQGYALLAISGSPHEAVAKLAKYYQFDDFAGTIHARREGRFTGEIALAHEGKDTLLRDMVARQGLSWKRSIAVGDSEGDIEMLEAVERPIAFNPSKKLFQHAEAKGWEVVVERKNVVYELTKYHDGYILDPNGQ